MKNYRKWFPIAMIAIMLLSWFLIANDVIKREISYREYLKEARKYADVEVTKYAVYNYNEALKLKPSSEVYAEVAKYYEQQGDFYALEDWCLNFIEQYPEESVAYESLLKTYYDTESYKDFYDLLDVVQKRGISSKEIKKMISKMKYTYNLDYNSYDDVGKFDINLCPVNSNGVWGFVNRYGEMRASIIYSNVGKFTESNLAPVVNDEGKPYFIDMSGARAMATKEEYNMFGPDIDGKFYAQTKNGKYVFLNEDFEPVDKKEYDDVIVVNEGIGAVKKGSKWSIVDDNLKEISSDGIDDIIKDEAGVAFYNNRMFVKKSGKYIMLDGKGKKVSDKTFNDAKPFSEGKYAAVKIGDGWSFVDKNGKVVSNEKYEDARSFSNGFAAVKIYGKWGFIDESENLVITPEFYEAKDFTAKGSCFVKTGDKWQLLKIYSMNRK